MYKRGKRDDMRFILLGVPMVVPMDTATPTRKLKSASVVLLSAEQPLLCYGEAVTRTRW